MTLGQYFPVGPGSGSISSGSGGGRIKLTTATTFYVRSDGSDSNDGSADSAAKAFLTFQHAYDNLCSSYDLGGQIITIKAGNEGVSKTFAGITVSQPWIGGGSVIIRGQSAANTSFNDQGTFGDAFTIQATLPGIMTIDFATLVSSAGDAIDHESSGIVHIGSNLTFGTVANNHIDCFGTGAIVDYSPDSVGAGYTIAGNANFHVVITAGGFVTDSLLNNNTGVVTLSGTPNFSFWVLEKGGIYNVQRTTFSGSVSCAQAVPNPGGYIGLHDTFNFNNIPGTGGINYKGGAVVIGIDKVYSSGGNIYWSAGDGTLAVDGVGNVYLWNGALFGWSSSGTVIVPGGASFETGWARDAAYALGQRSGAHAQRYSLYETFTNASNYSRMAIDTCFTTAGVHRFMSEAAGTGTQRIIAIDAFSKAGAPANTDLPSGTWALIDDTTNNQTWLVFNKGGTIRKVQLT